LGPLPDDLEPAEPEIPDQEGIDRLRHLAEAISETARPEEFLDDFPEAPEWLHEMAIDLPPMEYDENDETVTQRLFKEVERLTKSTEIISDEEVGIGEIAREDEVPESLVAETPGELETVEAETPADVEPMLVEAPTEAEIPGELEPVEAEIPVDAEPMLAEAPTEAEIPGELEPVEAETPVDAEPILAEAPTEAEMHGELEPVEVEAVSEAEVIATETPLAEEMSKPEHPTPSPKPTPGTKLTEKDAASLLQSAWSAARSGDIQTAAQVYGMLVKGRHLVPEVIESLQKALELHPDASSFWKVLGDAHMKADRLSEAMKAYQRGRKRV
jgi:tetratricopeptide (TPR) repeat protein